MIKNEEKQRTFRYVYGSLRWKFRNGLKYDWSSARTETDRLFRFKSYQAVCFSSCKTCQLSTSYSPTRSLLLTHGREKWEMSEDEEVRERMGWETLKSARWGSLLQTLCDYGAESKRDGIAPARFYGSFRFTFVIKIPRATVPPQTIPLSAKREEGITRWRTRNVREQQRSIYTCLDLYKCIPRW